MEKHVKVMDWEGRGENVGDIENICFLGTNVLWWATGCIELVIVHFWALWQKPWLASVRN